jgi:hypothetical protein
VGASFSLRLLDAVAAMGQERDFPGFCRRAMREISALVPCDQAFASVVTHSEEAPFERVSIISDTLPEKARSAYAEYYCYIDPARLACTPQATVLHMDWNQRLVHGGEFSRDFIHDLVHADMSLPACLHSLG